MQMKKRFIARKHYNITFFKIILYLIFILIGAFISIKVLFKSFIDNNDTNKINEMLAVSSNNLIGNISLLDIVSINLTKPESFLNLSFSSNVGTINYNTSETTENVIKNDEEEPLIYIYNTHQTEEYDAGTLKEYNIIPTVYMASNILKKRLSNYNINSVVEEENILDVLKENNWNYNESYYASKLWLEAAKEKYPSIKYFIDVHRDSATSTVNINDKNYAKMMFVVGMNHDNYEKNESLVIKLNDYLNENYEGLMRDIFYGKKSKYNQDFDENTILIEVGGPDNSIEEVSNSIYALADAIANIIGGI
jgi:stage II sporulation protein P